MVIIYTIRLTVYIITTGTQRAVTILHFTRTVYLCITYYSYNKQHLSLGSINILVLPMEKTVFCQVRTESLHKHKLLLAFNIPTLDQIKSPHGVLATSKAADQVSIMK
jgi:hypothetical protein